MRRLYLAAFLLIFLVLLSSVPLRADSIPLPLYHVTGTITVPSNTACACPELIDFSFDFGYYDRVFHLGPPISTDIVTHYIPFAVNLYTRWSGPIGTFESFDASVRDFRDPMAYLGIGSAFNDEIDFLLGDGRDVVEQGIPPSRTPGFGAQLYNCQSVQCKAMTNGAEGIPIQYEVTPIAASESPTSVLLLIAGAGILPFGAKRFLREGF